MAAKIFSSFANELFCCCQSKCIHRLQTKEIEAENTIMSGMYAGHPFLVPLLLVFN